MNFLEKTKEKLKMFNLPTKPSLFDFLILQRPELKYILTNNFMKLVSFYTPWKHQKTKSFSDVFRGYRKIQVTWNELTRYLFAPNQNVHYTQQRFICLYTMFPLYRLGFTPLWNSYRIGLLFSFKTNNSARFLYRISWISTSAICLIA